MADNLRHRAAEALVDSGSYVSVWDKDEWVRLPDDTITPAYLSCRRLLATPVYRKIIQNMLVEKAAESLPRTDIVAGLATAGIKWASDIADAHELPLCYVRGARKGYGIGGLVEGNPPTGTRALIVDDTLFSGESIGAAIGILDEEKSIKATGVLTIASLHYDSAEAFGEEVGIACDALTDYDAICSAAVSRGVLTADQGQQMLGYYADPLGYEFKR